MGSASSSSPTVPSLYEMSFPRKTRCRKQKIDITSLVVFFILENKPKIIQIFVFLVFGLSYIIQTIGNAQTFLLFGFPKKILPLLRPIACRSLQCPCGRRASKARKTWSSGDITSEERIPSHFYVTEKQIGKICNNIYIYIYISIRLKSRGDVVKELLSISVTSQRKSLTLAT